MNFNVGEVHRNAPHLFADLAELIALLNIGDQRCSRKSDLLSLARSSSGSLEEADSDEAELDVLRCDAERRDKVAEQLEDVWSQLEYRMVAMRDYYPFKVQGDKLCFVGDFDVRRRIYRLLLACSRLRSFHNAGGARQRWAKAFTCLSHLALQGLLPHHANIRIFDANSDDRRSHYGTNLRKALPKLGRELGAFNIDDAECAKCEAQGDGGIDLVGIVGFDDGAAGNYAIIGQCGARETEWPTKTLEATPMRFRSYFSLPVDWSPVMFTPICYRNANGEWLNNKTSSGVLLLDRIRILFLLDKADCWRSLSESQWMSNFELEFDNVKYEF
jgi:hypothetical protein